MKTKTILLLLTSLVFSICFGNIFASTIGTNVMIGNYDILPHICQAGIFATSFLPTISGVMALYVNVSVTKPAGTVGIGGDHKDKVVLFDWDDVTGGYTRDSKGIVITGPLTFSAGAYMIEVYATLHKIETSAKTSGDPDNKGIIQGVKFNHPGSTQAIREFRFNWMNKNIGIIDRKCSDSTMDLYGSPCKPLQMNFDSKDTKDENSSEFTFESTGKGYDIAIYNGTLTLAAVMGTIAADDVTPSVAAGEGQYQLTDGSVSAVTITKLDNPVDGAFYTLLGSGGTYPSIITSANDFELASGTTWNALAGSQITFKAFKNGVSTYKFIEISRS